MMEMRSLGNDYQTKGRDYIQVTDLADVYLADVQSGGTRNLSLRP